MDKTAELRRIGRRDPIILAHEDSFGLGPLIVRPATRTLDHRDGRREVLEPRVMQVLVALAQADGATLTREDLTELCWGGRIVGEDAICRVISRLRRTARTLAAGVFEIETTSRVGYRLVVADGAARTGRDAGRPATDAGQGSSNGECAYLLLTQSPGADLGRLVAALRDMPGVCLVEGLSGPADLLVRLDNRSIADVEVGRAAVASLIGVGRVQTSIVLARYLG